MKSDTQEFWVYLETSAYGSLRPVGLELLGKALTLCTSRSWAVVGVVLGHQIEMAIQEAQSYGCDKIVAVDERELLHYRADTYTSVLCSLIQKHHPNVLIIGATLDGKDLAPRVAARLKTGLTADCTDMEFQESSDVVQWTRPALSGHLMAKIICPTARPQMGTVRAGVFVIPSPNKESHSLVIRESFRLSQKKNLISLIQNIVENTDTINLEESPIIVAGGFGLGSKKGFDLMQALADSLGGMVGASRKVVEAGWIPRAYQVGQTGKNVRPRLYVACGISGALQHLLGMQNADCIVAINEDPDAPIFQIANYGIVGNLFEIIPAMIEELSRLNTDIQEGSNDE